MQHIIIRYKEPFSSSCANFANFSAFKSRAVAVSDVNPSLPVLWMVAFSVVANLFALKIVIAMFSIILL
jgi:hypothetical protein